MKTLLLALAMTATLALPVTANANANANAADDDPYLWLEEVQGERALAWVRERNAQSRAVLEAHPRFAEMRERFLEILDSKEKIPYVSRQGDVLLNLWRDAAHPRGLWRRTSLVSYRQATPAWETVLDLDALASAEKENWVWHGAACFGPAYRRCLISLSRGGADAHVVREFDTQSMRFVEAQDGGFVLPEAKSRVTWADADTLYVGSDFGPGSMTESGYPRIIKRWQRGQPLAAAATVYEGRPQDVSVYAEVDRTPGFERTLFGRATDFYNSEVAILQGDKTVVLDRPSDASESFWRQRLLLQLRSDWKLGDRTWPQGSLLVTDAGAYLRGERRFTALFTPSATRSLAGFATTKSQVLLSVLDNVAGRIEEWRPVGDRKSVV